MPRSPRSRRLALASLLAALWLPGLAAAAGDPPCCQKMPPVSDAPPCHGDDTPPPCESVDATACCDVAPAGALPAPAQRECSHTAAASLLRGLQREPEPLASAVPVPAPLSPHAPPARLSVVLRN